MKANESSNVSPCNSEVEQDDKNFNDVDSLNTDARGNDVDEIEFGKSDSKKEEDEDGSDSEKEEDEDGNNSEEESEI